MQIFFTLVFFFFTGIFIHAQQAMHEYKLPGDDYKLLKYKTENSRKVIDRYEKQVSMKEGSDSIVYVEFYSGGKHWNVYRYKLVNKKPELSGWQKEYDAKGRLYAEKFCETGKRKCKIFRTYSYYPGGQLMSDLSYYKDKAQGLHFYYYANGQMRQCMQFEENRLQEVLAYYDADGNPLDTGNFCQGDGLVNIYSMNGILIQQKIFENGKVHEVISVEKN